MVRFVGRRLRFYLAMMALAGTLPLLAAGVASVWMEGRRVRAITQDRFADTAAMMAAIAGRQVEIPPERLVKLAPQPVSSRLLAAVVDGNGHIVARSLDIERFVGTKVPDWDTLLAQKADRGVFEARTTEGRDVVFAFRQLRDLPGWVVVVGQPLAVFNAHWQRPLLDMVTAGALGLLVTLFASGWLARRILAPLQQLARQAQAVGSERGDELAADAVSELPVTEFEAIRSSVESAQAALEQRAQAERQAAQAVLHSELCYRTLAAAGALVLWRTDPQGHLLSATGWSGFTGRPESEAMGLGWQERVHPDDLALVKKAMRGQRGEPRSLDVECRLTSADGAWHWVRLRGAAVRTPDGTQLEWVGVLEDVNERRQAQQQLAHLARHDALTGLANRAELALRLEEASRRSIDGERAAVLYLDLDRFKAVNDTLGHAVGDQLLVAVAQRLRQLVRHGDVIARLGGDEFVMLLTALASADDALVLAERVVERIGTTYELEEQQVSVGVSIGIALIQGGGTADEALRRADSALYRAKRDGRSCYRLSEEPA